MASAGGQHVVDDEEQAGRVGKAEEKAASTLPHPIDDDPHFLVSFGSRDQDNPHNWSTPYRSWLTAQLGLLALAASSGEWPGMHFNTRTDASQQVP
jgi:hypothetical protein